jgi:hypothetical protein
MFPEPYIAADCTQAFASFQILGIHSVSNLDNHKRTTLTALLKLGLPTVVFDSLPL